MSTFCGVFAPGLWWYLHSQDVLYVLTQLGTCMTRRGGYYIRTCILYCPRPLPQVTLVRFIPELTNLQDKSDPTHQPGSEVFFFVEALWGQKITLVFGTREMIFNLLEKANLLKSSCGVEELVNWNLSNSGFK